MCKVSVLFLFVCAVYVEVSAKPPEPPQVLCGEIPSKIFSCLNVPIIGKDASDCQGNNSCEKLTCYFRQSGWMTGPSVNKAKLREVFDMYGVSHPEWAPLIEPAKAACATYDLPAQGYYLNCPAYDVVTCWLHYLIKNAQPSQWSTSPKCEAVRRFAASCPLCPSECFSQQIPIGSCNACYALPRSP
uniref:Odorant-binding protein 10 n=1 Tax=Cnaphalocrocis medinalis TaxID=437488 RepID=A0A0U3AAD5_CNAME|nr:odorant-binding protein 10 [Cnaphalocrocis medinalis]